MNELQRTISETLQSDPQSNPAMNTIITDYAKFHGILALLGGCVLLLFALLSVFFLVKCKRTPKNSKLKWGFEKKVYFSFGILCSIVALLLIVIVGANASNTLDPVQGFSLALGSF